MIEVRAFKALGGADHGWLKAKHHFSFGGYYNPERMGWGSIRVWNDDEIAPHTGFPPQGQSDGFYDSCGQGWRAALQGIGTILTPPPKK